MTSDVERCVAHILCVCVDLLLLLLGSVPLYVYPHLLILLLPAIFASIIAGGAAPFMTFVVRQAFDAFAHFPITPDPPQAARDALLRDVN